MIALNHWFLEIDCGLIQFCIRTVGAEKLQKFGLRGSYDRVFDQRRRPNADNRIGMHALPRAASQTVGETLSPRMIESGRVFIGPEGFFQL